MVFGANARNKKDDTAWKAVKNWAEKLFISCEPFYLRSQRPFQRRAFCIIGHAGLKHIPHQILVSDIQRG